MTNVTPETASGIDPQIAGIEEALDVLIAYGRELTYSIAATPAERSAVSHASFRLFTHLMDRKGISDPEPRRVSRPTRTTFASGCVRSHLIT